MADNKSLATKLAEIGQKIGAVEKTGKNGQQGYNYIEYGVVAARIRELLSEYEVMIIPRVDSYSAEEITNRNGGKGYHYLLSMSFKIINGGDPEDCLEASWMGEAADYGDKGINKAETSGTKYFLMRLFNVSERSEEDNDKTTPDITGTQPLERPVAQPAPKPKFAPRDVAIARKHLEMAKTMDELKVIFETLGDIKGHPEVVIKKDEMKAMLSEKEAQDGVDK